MAEMIVYLECIEMRRGCDSKFALHFSVHGRTLSDDDNVHCFEMCSSMQA